jgi:hypothetical protein
MIATLHKNSGKKDNLDFNPFKIFKTNGILFSPEIKYMTNNKNIPKILNNFIYIIMLIF